MRAVQGSARRRRVLPGPVAGVEDPVGDHVHRRVEVEVLPLGAVRAPVADPVAAGSGCWSRSWNVASPSGTAARGRSGSPGRPRSG